MLKFSIIFALLICSTVRSDICDSACVCRINDEDERDYLGEYIDCSFYDGSEDILRANFSLPSIIYLLNLSSNNVTQLQASSLLKSATLTELYLNRNAIKEIRSKIMMFPQLKVMDLSDNELEYVGKEAFAGVSKLEYLNLANNKLTSHESVAFHRLGNLLELVLDNNDLGSSLSEVNLFDRHGFGLTPKIRTLSISGVNLNVIPDNFFSNTYDIRKLIISKNNLSDVFELPFTLEYLDLSDNPIKEISDEDFADLPGLKVLKLNNLHITEVPDFAFTPLHSLVHLELARNKNLTVFSSLAFGQDVLGDANDFTLEILSLMGSRLTKLEEQLAEPFGHLIVLDLQGNPWRCDCKMTWIKSLQIEPEYYEHLR